MSNDTLFTCREAPGEAASRTRCSDKKQLFEQQLKHCSRFLKKNMNWAQNQCRKLTGLLNLDKKYGWVAEMCCLLKTKAKVENESVETIVEAKLVI